MGKSFLVCWHFSKDKLYGISKKLYSEKDGLEKYLSRKTNELFDLQDKIILYDLSNTYFEGRMANSKIGMTLVNYNDEFSQRIYF